MKEIWYGLDEYTRMAIGLVVAFLLFSLYCYIGYKIEYKSSDESLRSKTKQPKKGCQDNRKEVIQCLTYSY